MKTLIKLWRKRADGWSDGMFNAFALRSDESREKRIARTFRICAKELEDSLKEEYPCPGHACVTEMRPFTVHVEGCPKFERSGE